MMDQDEALAGDYVSLMLVMITVWVASIAIGLAVGGYFALRHL